jgi:hypothetical protein
MDRKLYFRGSSYKVKFRLARSAKVCCACDDGTKYNELRGVVLWGRSQIVSDANRIDSAATLMDAKYAGLYFEPPRDPTTAQKSNEDLKTWVEIQPERVSSWDNTKLVG